MHFSRVTLAKRSFQEQYQLWSGHDYSIHQILWELFPEDPDAKRDFLYRVEDEGTDSRIYLLSQRAPLKSNKMFRVETKPFFPKVEKGSQFLFSLRVNPVVSQKNEGRQQRRDVVMAALHGEPDKSRRRERRQELIIEKGKEWLVRRSEGLGFKVIEDTLQVDRYQKMFFKKPKQPQPLSITTIDYDGLLEVLDPEIFRSTLARGVGPAKGFGCGLLLIRNPR